MSSSGFDFSPSRRGGDTGARVGPPRAAPRDADWPRWLRAIERGRRLWTTAPTVSSELLAEVTACSFALEGLAIDLAAERRLDRLVDRVMDRPVNPRLASRALRSRSQVRMRNHMAILMAIARCCGRGYQLCGRDVLRWYTSISSGLSTSVLSIANMRRIEQAVERINSPQLRPQAALTEMANLHAELLADPVFPSFNGILARLLLTAHLARCGLPPVTFDPQRDAHQTEPALLLARLCELIQEQFDGMVSEQKSISPA